MSTPSATSVVGLSGHELPPSDKVGPVDVVGLLLYVVCGRFQMRPIMVWTELAAILVVRVCDYYKIEDVGQQVC